jgi:hypothetical protein
MPRCAQQACSSTHKASFGDDAFLGSCNGGGSASLSVFISVALELGSGRSLRWLQETLGIILYFSIS